MNPAMWTHPATAASVTRLRSWGARFVELGQGRTACGEVGEGRLAEPEVIVAALESALARPRRKLRVLVTSGGTSEPVDGVRVLTNTSTGATGALIADQLARAGHDVVLLRATQAKHVGAHVREETFDTFAALDTALERWLTREHFDAVIHAAAVSDFSVHAIEVDGTAHAPGKAKLSSDTTPMLRLRRNPKLLDLIRPRSRNPAVRVVAFKLTQGAATHEVRRAVEALLKTGAADLVVHNDLSARTDDGNFPAQIWSASGAVEACETRSAIGIALERILTAGDTGAPS
jgi:phosphopantothenoylcysteine decarboxylase/phosphopantothenate--cysteine ligase